MKEPIALTVGEPDAAPSVMRAPAHMTLPLVIDARWPSLVHCDNTLGTLVARCGGSGFEFTGWTSEQCEQVAAFVALAVNCHDDLLEALKDARRELYDARHSHMSEAEFEASVDYINAAIAKATPNLT